MKILKIIFKNFNRSREFELDANFNIEIFNIKTKLTYKTYTFEFITI